MAASNGPVRRRFLAAVAVLAALVLGAAACGDDAENAENAEGLGDGSLGVVEVAAGEVIRIRSLFALEGDAGSGPTNARVVPLAVDDFGSIHGFGVDVGAAVDDGCSPEGGEVAGRRIAAQSDVVGVIGTSCSAAAVTAAPLLTGAGMLMISPSNTSPLLTSDLAGNPSENYNEGYYRTADNDLYQGTTVAQFLYEKKGIGAVAAIHNGDAYTQSLVAAFADAFEKLGGTVTGVGVVSREETNLMPTLTDLAAGSPQALFFPVSRTVGSSIVQQLPGVVGLEGVLRIAGDGLLSDAFLVLKETEGMFFSGPNLQFGINANESTGLHAADILAAYEDRYGTAPEAAFWGHAYDAAVLLLEAIRAASRIDGDSLVIDRAGVREYLDGVSGYSGIIGSITCDDFGDCGVRRLVVVEHLDSTNPAGTRTNIVYEYAP